MRESEREGKERRLLLTAFALTDHRTEHYAVSSERVAVAEVLAPALSRLFRGPGKLTRVQS